jgi:hypothetical protein
MNPPLTPPPSFRYLTFVEGNPGVPGDGVFVNASGGADGILLENPASQSVSLGQTSNGITISVFPPAGATVGEDPENIFVEFRVGGSLNSQCGQSSDSLPGSVLLNVQTPIVHGVQGRALIISQAGLEELAQDVRGIPGCSGVSLSRLEFTSLDITGINFAEIQTIDAVAIGFGESVFPTESTPPPDRTPPTVISVLPAGGAVGIDRFSSVSATFDEDMNAGSVDASSFMIVDANGAAVSGTVSFDEASNTASFAPDSPLSLLTQYTVTLSTAITDAAGNALANPETWSFTIADGDWDIAQVIDQGSVFSSTPELAVDNIGNVLAVWIRDDGSGTPNIWANRYSAANETWGMPQLLENEPGSASNIGLVMDAAGNAIAVWDQEDAMALPQIWASRYDAANEAWGTAEMLSDSTGSGMFPRVAIDPNGSAIAVWEQDDLMGAFDIRASRYSVSDGNWSASVPLESSLGAAFSPVIAMDASGNGIVAWEQEDIPGSSLFDIFANRYSAAGDSWGTADRRSRISVAGGAFNLQIAINAGGDAVMVWESLRAIRATVYEADDDFWTPSTFGANLSDDDDGAALGDAEAAQAGIDAAGNITIVFRQDDGAGVFNIRAARWDDDGWATPNAFLDNGAENAGFPQLSVGANGDAIVAWTQADGIGIDNLYVNTYTPGDWRTASLNESAAGSVLLTRVVMDATGNAIVTWAQDDGTGTNTANVFANRYSANTVSWSAPEQLDDGTGDDVGPHTLAISANGVAAAAWQHLNMSGAIDVYGNHFD